jgi:hypothetical protein
VFLPISKNIEEADFLLSSGVNWRGLLPAFLNSHFFRGNWVPGEGFSQTHVFRVHIRSDIVEPRVVGSLISHALGSDGACMMTQPPERFSALSARHFSPMPAASGISVKLNTLTMGSFPQVQQVEGSTLTGQHTLSLGATTVVERAGTFNWCFGTFADVAESSPIRSNRCSQDRLGRNWSPAGKR